MKFPSILRTALIVGVALFSSISIYAQTTQPAPTPKPKMTEEQRQERQQKRYDKIAQDLNLTAEQKAKFQETDRAYDAKMREKHASSKEDMTKMRQERMNAHRAILTKEQAAKYDEMQAKKQQKMQDHKQRKGDKMKKGGETGNGRTTPTPAPGNNKTQDNRERE